MQKQQSKKYSRRKFGNYLGAVSITALIPDVSAETSISTWTNNGINFYIPFDLNREFNTSVLTKTFSVGPMYKFLNNYTNLNIQRSLLIVTCVKTDEWKNNNKRSNILNNMNKTNYRLLASSPWEREKSYMLVWYVKNSN